MSKRVIPSGKIIVCEDASQFMAETEMVQSRIRQRAYEISVSRGHAGRETEDWLSAESEIVSVPPVELTENDGAYTLRVKAAGIDPKNIQILTNGEQILLKGELGQGQEERNSAVIHLSEFRQAPLFRCLRFPESVIPKSIKMQSENGLLTIIATKASGSAAPLRVRKTAASPKPKRAAGGKS